MDLKFTFSGSAHDRSSDDHAHDGHGHGGAGSGPGIPLPFAGATNSGSASSTLELRVSLVDAAGTMACEAFSGDGVSYARAEKAVRDRDPAALAAAARSVLARCGAELPEPLLGSVTEVSLTLGGAEAAVLAELGLGLAPHPDPAAPVSSVDDALQARTGIAAGTPIRISA